MNPTDNSTIPYPRIMSQLLGQPWDIDAAEHARLLNLVYTHQRGAGAAGLLPVPRSAAVGSAASSEWRTAYVDEDAPWLAVLPVDGIIAKRMSLMESLCGGCDLDHLDADLAHIPHTSVNTVVFDINSPGGMALPTYDTVSRIRALSEAGIRTIAYSSMDCCSAAYHIAAACDEIYCAPTARVGNIGTYLAMQDESEKWAQEGRQLKMYKVGSLKGAGTPGKPFTADEDVYFQSQVETLDARFKAFVQARRPDVSPEALEGQAFEGRQAVSLGFADAMYLDLETLLRDLVESHADLVFGAQ